VHDSCGSAAAATGGKRKRRRGRKGKKQRGTATAAVGAAVAALAVANPALQRLWAAVQMISQRLVQRERLPVWRSASASAERMGFRSMDGLSSVGRVARCEVQSRVPFVSLLTLCVPCQKCSPPTTSSRLSPSGCGAWSTSTTSSAPCTSASGSKLLAASFSRCCSMPLLRRRLGGALSFCRLRLTARRHGQGL